MYDIDEIYTKLTYAASMCFHFIDEINRRENIIDKEVDREYINRRASKRDLNIIKDSTKDNDRKLTKLKGGYEWWKDEQIRLSNLIHSMCVYREMRNTRR